MANITGFDAAAIEPQSFEALPVGIYNAIIIASEWNQTRSGNGRYLKLTFQVYEGEYKGRQLFARLNLENPNTQTVEIARQQLSAICRAVGVLRPNDTCELHNLPLAIKVILTKNKMTDEVYNEIKDYRKKGDCQMQTAPAPAAANPPSAPWKR